MRFGISTIRRTTTGTWCCLSGHPPNDAESDDRDVSSAHRGFAQFLMCDGSVRAVGESIDAGMHRAFSTRAGGEAVFE
ncbi:MAG: DUF1559 domain-containing protein [Planctomycetia bacterium]|nr:DUF1559 domain-containing protein [Planctomycetia bacterium]